MRADGTYLISGLDAGAATIAISAPMYLPCSLELSLIPRSNTCDIIMKPRLKVVELVDSRGGAPLTSTAAGKYRYFPWATIVPVVTTEPPGFEIGLAEGDVDYGLHWSGRAIHDTGHYTVQCESAPVLFVSAVLSGFVLGSVRVCEEDERVIVPVSPPAVEKLLSTVRVRFVDMESNVPITDGRVAVGTPRTVFFRGVCPDYQGLVTIHDVIPGIMMLWADIPGYEELHRTVLVNGGKKLDMGTIPLGKGHVIRGVLLDEAGQGIKGYIWCRRLEDLTFPQQLDPRWRVDTDEAGRFIVGEKTVGPTGFEPVGPLGSGTYLIYAGTDSSKVVEDEWAANPSMVSVCDDDVRDVVVHLERGIEVNLSIRIGRVGTYLVTVRDAQDIPVWTSRVFGAETKELRLRRGGYEATVAWNAEVVSTREFGVSEDGDTVEVVVR